MSIIGWYYLHTNGDLIYKRDLDGAAADIRESDFTRAMWPIGPEDREGAWNILVEACALGAMPTRIHDLAEKWHCDESDIDTYAQRLGVKLEMDGNAWCATGPNFKDLVISPAGFGPSKFLAMVELCKALGYPGGRMWNHTFKSLLEAQRAKVLPV